MAMIRSCKSKLQAHRTKDTAALALDGLEMTLVWVQDPGVVRGGSGRI